MIIFACGWWLFRYCSKSLSMIIAYFILFVKNSLPIKCLLVYWHMVNMVAIPNYLRLSFCMLVLELHLLHNFSISITSEMTHINQCISSHRALLSIETRCVWHLERTIRVSSINLLINLHIILCEGWIL